MWLASGLKIAASALIALFVSGGEASGAELMKPIYTMPGELGMLADEEGPHHPQGAAVSEQAIYISYSKGIVKLDWSGRVIKTCKARAHLGDIAYSNGRIYGVFGLWKREKTETKLMVGVWDEDLNLIATRHYDYPNARGFDSAVVIGDTLYTSIDHYWDGKGRFHHPPHRDNTVMMISTKDLSVKGIKDVVFDYPIHFSTQNLSTDGENLLFVNYGAKCEEGNDPWLNYTRTTASLEKLKGNFTFFGQWGCDMVPRSIAKRDYPVFFTVNAIDHGKWGTGSGKKQPQLRLDFFSYDKTTGVMKDITDKSWKPAGFWRVSQHADGRWWVIAPNGAKTFLRGVDHVNWGGMWCEALGYSPYRKNMEKQFASRSDWVVQTVERLKNWGFNALGAGCSDELRRCGIAHCEFLGMGESFCAKGGDCALGAFEGVPGSAFPNVFHPDFEKFCNERAAKMCASQKDDSSLFGYFFDNELAWWVKGTPSTGIYDAAAAAPKSHSANVALRTFLSERGVLEVGANVPEAVKIEFIRFAAQRYFATIASAVRRHDPNHLLLGCRFAGLNTAHKVVWEEAGKVCDVVTFNQYPWVELEENTAYLWRASPFKIPEAFADRYSWVNRPMLITEWSFISLDSGLPCTGGWGQRFKTQEERVKAAELYAKTLFAMPFIVGYDYFMWVDEPSLGISRKFPENSNYGLVDERGEPYAALTEMFTRIHHEAESLHAQGKIPQSRKAKRVSKAKSTNFPSASSCFRESEKSVFVRKENDYILRSPSGLVLKGRIGGRFAFDSVKCGDVDCGPFTFMLYNGEYRDIDRVDSVEWHSNRGVLRVVGSAMNGRSSFRIKCDIVPFSEKQWFACNVVEVENTGKEEFTDVSVLLRQYAPWAKDWLDPQTCKPVPDLWMSPPSYAWFRKSDSVWFGAATFAKTVLNFRYYVSPDGGSHPDATFNATGDASKPFPIKAGRTWKPYGGIWMVAAFGKGGLNGWNGFLDEFSTWYEHASR